MATNKQWSTKYKQCANCKTTKNPHSAKGLCANCYTKNWRASNLDRSKEIHNRFYAKHKERIDKTAKKAYYAKKEQIKIYNKRLIRALRKNGYTDKKIVTFFGIKI